MRNLIIIVVVFWFLFLNGFSTVGKLINSSATQTVVKGAATVVASNNTGGVAAAPASGVKINKPAVQIRTTSGGASVPRPQVVVPQGIPALPTATPVPTPDVLRCENANIGDTCMNADGEMVILVEDKTALQNWTDMSDVCAEANCSPAEGTPTSSVPTECIDPPNERARVSCDLIKRGVIHPKG